MSDRISITQYAIDVAHIVARRSEDPKRKVGAIALDRDNRIIATAYNGLPSGFSFGDDFWSDDDLRRKFVVHAETNLCSLTHRGSIDTVAITTIPCGPCALNLVAHGVKRVIYTELYHRDLSGQEIMLNYGIELIQALPSS